MDGSYDGGYYFTDPAELDSVETIESKETVRMSQCISNTAGTIVMVKVGGDSGGATLQWFINLVDNSCNLYLQNGRFTVFFQVISGME